MWRKVELKDTFNNGNENILHVKGLARCFQRPVRFMNSLKTPYGQVDTSKDNVTQ